MQVPTEAENKNTGGGGALTQTSLSHIPAEVPSAPHPSADFSGAPASAPGPPASAERRGPSPSAARCVKAAFQLSHGGPSLRHTLWPFRLPGGMQMNTVWQVNRVLTCTHSSYYRSDTCQPFKQ